MSEPTHHEIFCDRADFNARWIGARTAAIVDIRFGIRAGDVVTFRELEPDTAAEGYSVLGERALVADVLDAWEEPHPALAALVVLSLGRARQRHRRG